MTQLTYCMLTLMFSLSFCSPSDPLSSFEIVIYNVYIIVISPTHLPHVCPLFSPSFHFKQRSNWPLQPNANDLKRVREEVNENSLLRCKSKLCHTVKKKSGKCDVGFLAWTFCRCRLSCYLQEEKKVSWSIIENAESIFVSRLKSK